MRTPLTSLILCVNIGLCLPVFYGNGEACHLVWIVSGCIIGISCYFLISFFMSKLIVQFSPKTFLAKQLFSLGYFVAPLLAYLLILLLVKTMVKHR
jgi:hypothetical protein